MNVFEDPSLFCPFLKEKKYKTVNFINVLGSLFFLKEKMKKIK